MTDLASSAPRLVAIGMGSNLGDSWTILRQACKALSELPCTQLRATSRIRLTQPIRVSDQGSPFFNAVALLETALPPRELLDGIMAIEQRFGRERNRHWASRTLDLDILLDEAGPFYDQRLLIPHPRLGSRLFFLASLEELLPDWRHPWCGLTVRQMVEILSTRPPYCVLIWETFLPTHAASSLTTHSGEIQAGEADWAALWQACVAANKVFQAGCPHLEDSGGSVSAGVHLTHPPESCIFNAEEVQHRLAMGQSLAEIVSFAWLEHRKQDHNGRDTPLPRVMILGPRAKDLLWPAGVNASHEPLASPSFELANLSWLRDQATPVVFSEADDPQNWAEHIIAAIDASAEIGHVLGDLG